MGDTKTSAPNQRSFSLKSEDADAALCVPRDPWVWAGGLPREPRWPRPAEGVTVCAEDDEAAGEAFGEWLAHVEAGKVGCGD
jgi:hypothetical protein